MRASTFRQSISCNPLSDCGSIILPLSARSLISISLMNGDSWMRKLSKLSKSVQGKAWLLTSYLPTQLSDGNLGPMRQPASLPQRILPDPGLAAWTTAPGTEVLPVPSSALGDRANLKQHWVVKSPDTWVLAPPRASSHFSL